MVVSQALYTCHSPSHLESFVLGRLLEWLAEQNHHLEHLWLTNDEIIRQNYEVMTGSDSPVKSLIVLDESEEWDFPLNDERFLQLQNLSGLYLFPLPFSRLDQLPNLKFFRGECYDDDEVSYLLC